MLEKTEKYRRGSWNIWSRFEFCWDNCVIKKPFFLSDSYLLRTSCKPLDLFLNWNFSILTLSHDFPRSIFLFGRQKPTLKVLRYVLFDGISGVHLDLNGLLAESGSFFSNIKTHFSHSNDSDVRKLSNYFPELKWIWLCPSRKQQLVQKNNFRYVQLWWVTPMNTISSFSARKMHVPSVLVDRCWVEKFKPIKFADLFHVEICEVIPVGGLVALMFRWHEGKQMGKNALIHFTKGVHWQGAPDNDLLSGMKT